MSGSIYGKLFRISTWGESHGKALGVVIDGCPAGIGLSEQDIQPELDRRKPGSSKFATKRAESDTAQILSGVFEGKTTGTPISIAIFNEDQKSKDYSEIANVFRPGHADYTFHQKYGFRDYRGGGRSSGRETASRVAAGAVAKKILKELNIDIAAYTINIGGIEIDRQNFDLAERFNNPLVIPDKQTYEKCAELLEKRMENLDSSGGIAECIIKGVKPGVGETVFDKLDAELAKSMLSIGGVKGIEFGSGFQSPLLRGSESNDNFYNSNGKIQKLTNNSGGVLGGMADGSDIIFRLVFKPTPSIFKKQKTVNIQGENTEIAIKGRHDPIIIARAIVVIEAMAAITLTDLIFQDLLSNIAGIRKLYL